MEQIQVLIDKTPENYGAVAQYGEHAFMVTGKSIEELRQAMQEAILETHEWLLEEGKPSNLDKVELVYTLTASALLSKLTNILTRTALSQATGINARQLSRYALGLSKPREAQAEKIRQGIRAIGLELSQV